MSGDAQPQELGVGRSVGSGSQALQADLSFTGSGPCSAVQMVGKMSSPFSEWNLSQEITYILSMPVPLSPSLFFSFLF